MNAFLKKFGLIGGTAAACAACCAAPVVLGPLLAWLGVAGLGLAFSPWYLLVLAAPAAMLAVQLIRKKAGPAKTTGCGCAPSLPNERKNHGCQ
jgi:hypothetical protein